MSRRVARATQADIGRAIKAAEKAGAHMAVEILPDGTIRLVPVDGDTMNPAAHPLRPVGGIVL